MIPRDIYEDTGWHQSYVRPTREGERGPMVLINVPMSGYICEVWLPVKFSRSEADRVCAVIKSYAFPDQK